LIAFGTKHRARLNQRKVDIEKNPANHPG
jgi:hypothetical protein